MKLMEKGMINREPEQEGEEEKTRYWDSILTGDMNTVPDRIKAASGVSANPDDVEQERLADRIMRSWAVDHLGVSKEEAQMNWGGIRKSLAAQWKTDEDDRQLFLTLSERRREDEGMRERLYRLYSDSYNGALSQGDVGKIRGGADDRLTGIPERFREAASFIVRRGEEDALSERQRLGAVAEEVWSGVRQSLVNEQGTAKDGSFSWKDGTLGMIAVKNMMRVRGSLSAVEKLRELDEEDRQKVYAMLAPHVREAGGLGERLAAGLTRGIEDVADQTAQLGANAYSLGIGRVSDWVERLTGEAAGALRGHADDVAETARVYEELKRFAREEIAPVHVKGASWIDDALIDSTAALPMTALAFGGPLGIGLLSMSETGRQMADARQMNPAGDYEAQMGAAVGSGTINTLLSLGMSRLGIRLTRNAFKTFRGTANAATVADGMRALGSGAVHGARDLGMMMVENKLQELSQYGAQELAAATTGKESGVPWKDWQERQASLQAQLREAGTMFPFLLVGAGKVSLRHFKDSKAILAEGNALRKLGVPENEIHEVLVEPDIGLKSRKLQEALRRSPLWGSMYLGKKAFEWARILEDPQTPLFHTEQEAREFFDMGSARGEKPWKKWSDEKELALSQEHPDQDFHAELFRERWMMRSGLPKVEPVRNADGQTLYRAVYGEGVAETATNPAQDVTAALKDWHEAELRSEQDDLKVLSSPDPNVLPERIAQNGLFDPNSDRIRRNYLSGRLQELINRPYRTLLLKYPSERISELKWDADAFDGKTLAEGEAQRSIVYEGVMRMAGGGDRHSESGRIAGRMWRQWFAGDPAAVAKGMAWLDDVRKAVGEERFARQADFAGARELMRAGNLPEPAALSEAFQMVSDRLARERSVVRDELPFDLRAMCRLVWKTQADATALCHLIPNLPDFGVLLGRGFRLDQAYARMLQQHLEIAPDVVARYAHETDTERLDPGKGMPKGYEYYEFMDDAVRLLDTVSHDNVQNVTGADGQPLWRIKYPNGRYSAWHESEQLARQDLAAHLAGVFAPGRHDLLSKVPFLMKQERRPGASGTEGDLNVYRLREGMSGGAVFDQLSERATADLVAHYFGKRSLRAPGEDIIVHGSGQKEADGMLSQADLSERKNVFDKYVGPVVDMRVDASNRTLNNNLGLLRQRLELYNHQNPLGVIEDKAEIAWDRLIRSGQLPERDAWRTLKELGRIDGDPGSYVAEGHYMQLIEELSQLSKEYYLGHLDHPFVPESSAAWGRYAVARPLPTRAELNVIKERARESLAKKTSAMTRQDIARIDEWVNVTATAEMRNLAEASTRLPLLLKGKDLPGGWLAMLEDSVCMNENARVERYWGTYGLKDAECLPMTERYIHGIQRGNLIDVLPAHIARDLVPRLAGMGTEEGTQMSSAEMESRARAVLDNLSRRLADTPGLVRWSRDVSGTGMYQQVVRKGDKAGLFEPEPGFEGRTLTTEPSWQKRIDVPRVKAPEQIFDDYYIRSSSSLPARWSGREEMVRAVEALGIIRDELSKRPLPTSEGIRWNGELYHGESEQRPGSIPAEWHVDVPLMGAIPPMMSIDSGSPYAKGTHTPDLRDVVKSMESLKNCVVYIDPDDRSHTVRLMPGSPEAPNREARAPYVVHAYHGLFLDRLGRPVPAGNLRDSYIPLEQFENTDVHVELKGSEAIAWRQTYRNRFLDELCEHDMQKRAWWDEGTGDSSVTESVMRLYEELGMAAAYERGELGLHDPAFVEMLRFVGHVLNRPGALSSGLESGSMIHEAILTEGQTLRRLYGESQTMPDQESQEHRDH